MIILSTVNIYTNISSGSQWFPKAKRRRAERAKKKIHKIILYFVLLRGVRLLSTDKMNATWWTATRTDGKTTRFKSGNSPYRYAVWETTERAVDTGYSVCIRVNACVQRYQLITLKVTENTHTHSLSPVPFRLVSNALSPKMKSYLSVRTLSTRLSKPYIPLNQELDKSPTPGCHSTHCFPERADYF